MESLVLAEWRALSNWERKQVKAQWFKLYDALMALEYSADMDSVGGLNGTKPKTSTR